MRDQGQGPVFTAALLKGDRVQHGERGRCAECKFLCSSTGWVDGCEKEKHVHAFYFLVVEHRKYCL